MVPSPLTVVDFGYEATMLEPLERRVTPGSYAVDVAIASDRCAAMRIILGPGEPVSWHPAVSPDGGHVAGVDAGNIAVLDLPTYAGASVRDKERAYDDFTLNPAQDSGLLLAFDGRPPIGAVSSSGWGDGAYPVYWGADAQGPACAVGRRLPGALPRPQERTRAAVGGRSAPSSGSQRGGARAAHRDRAKVLRSTARLVVDNPNGVEYGVAVIDDHARQVELTVDDEGDAEADRAVYTFPGKPGPAWTVKVKAELGGTII